MSEHEQPNQKEGPLMQCRPASFMTCLPAEDEKGTEKGLMVTIGFRGEIQPIWFSVADGQKLVAQLLWSLAQTGDDFADAIFQDRIAVCTGGYARWPAPEEQLP